MGMFTVWQLAKSKQALIMLILCLSIAFAGCTYQTAPDKSCPEFSQGLDKLEGKNYGKILFDRDSSTDVLYNKLENPYLYTFKDHKKEPIINGFDFSVSNDRSLIAYQLIDENMLIISDSNGKILATTFTQYEDIQGWVNDGLILYDYSKDKSVLLNPFNGKRTNLPEDLPNRYTLKETWRIGAYEKVYYDTSMTNAFYFAKDKQTNSYYFSLWDTLANEETARLPQSGFAESFPAEWALDGKQVIVYASSADGKQTALFSIHTDGEVKTLMVGESPVFALAPDGQNLAFWAHDDIQELWSLSVLDMSSGNITDYCISSKYFPEAPPLWSPDSQNLVVYLRSDDLENTKSIFIDRKQNIAVQLTENARPIGWLK
jgi:hypothetical protein